MMTTKYPLGVILVELCQQLARRRAALRAQWVPRLENEEADALTNSDFRHFSSEHRIDVDLESLPFDVLPRLLECGENFVSELADIKLAKVSGHDGSAKRRRLMGDGSSGQTTMVVSWWGGRQFGCQCRTAIWGSRPV